MTETGTSEPIWLCLCLTQLPLEIFTRGLADAEKDRPIVVLEKKRVHLCNFAASNIGIGKGNSMDTAYTLSEQVISFERNEEKEYASLAQLAQWAYQFTPNVSIKAPDSLLLDISGCQKLFKGIAPLRQMIEDGLKQLGHTPQVGFGKTPLAALAYACAGSDATQTLDNLAIDHLNIDNALITSLHQMGITQVGKLLALPVSGLTRRFGTYFTDYLARLTGQKPDPQKFISPEPRFHNEIAFAADVDNLSALAFPINRLLGELENFLTARQLCTNHITWRLNHRSQPSRSISISLANAESNQKIFRALTQLKFDQVNDVVEVDCIALTVNSFTQTHATSGDLFHGTRFQQKEAHKHRTSSSQQADFLINQLNAKLGNDTCYGLSTANDHRPEKAWQFVRLGQAPLENTPVDSNPRPVFLLGTPRALNVIEGQPCLGGRLDLLKGPERIDFGWWDEPHCGKPLARDYYIARQTRTNGSLFWVFKQQLASTENRWYLHGIFS